MVTSHPFVFFPRFTRKAALITFIANLLGGCVSDNASQRIEVAAPNHAFVAMYGAHPEETFPVPATDVSRVKTEFLRREAEYVTDEQPGTIIVDTHARYLYLVRENQRALRYGIGVGAEGMRWSGRAQVGRKASWPRWTPTAAMIRRDPERNGPWAKGMPPGLENPLGPRAIYLFQDGKDTLYRIHGTNEPHTIGEAVSSGCIRMLNQDIIDLYSRVPVGARVVVRNGSRMIASPAAAGPRA